MLTDLSIYISISEASTHISSSTLNRTMLQAMQVVAVEVLLIQIKITCLMHVHTCRQMHHSHMVVIRWEVRQYQRIS